MKLFDFFKDMITKVSIKKVANYGEIPAVLETDKKINLIYGLNGAGKTVLSNYLANKDSTDFSSCSIEGLSNEKILVYNQDFIEKNFYEKSTQKGIFTLSSENKEAEEKIKEAEEKVKDIDFTSVPLKFRGERVVGRLLGELF